MPAPPLTGIVRSISSIRMLGTVGASVVIGAWVQVPIPIPISASSERLWPLACLSALPAASVLWATGVRWLERASGRGRVVRALGVLLVIATVLAALAVGVLANVGMNRHGSLHGWELLRNFSLVLGISLLTGVAGAGELLWIPGLAVAMGCWLLGSAPVGLPPATWALTLQPIGDVASLAVAATALGLGTAGYLAGADARGRAARPG